LDVRWHGNGQPPGLQVAVVPVVAVVLPCPGCDVQRMVVVLGWPERPPTGLLAAYCFWGAFFGAMGGSFAYKGIAWLVFLWLLRRG